MQSNNGWSSHIRNKSGDTGRVQVTKSICLLRWEWKLIELLKGHLRGEDHTEGRTSWPRKKVAGRQGPGNPQFHAITVERLTELHFVHRKTNTHILVRLKITGDGTLLHNLKSHNFSFYFQSGFLSTVTMAEIYYAHPRPLDALLNTLILALQSLSSFLNCLNVNSSERGTERKCEI